MKRGGLKVDLYGCFLRLCNDGYSHVRRLTSLALWTLRLATYALPSEASDEVHRNLTFVVVVLPTKSNSLAPTDWPCTPPLAEGGGRVWLQIPLTCPAWLSGAYTASIRT